MQYGGLREMRRMQQGEEEQCCVGEGTRKTTDG